MPLFEHMLRAERYFPTQNARGDFNTPVLGECDIPAGQDPLLATNARGQFMPTRTSKTGSARYGFSQCAIEDEAVLLGRLYRCLSTQSPTTPRCSDVPQAIMRLHVGGLEAQAIVLSAVDAAVMLGVQETEPEGLVGVVQGMNVLVADLPKGAALVMTAPARLGIYQRVEDYVGLLFYRIDQNMVVVDDVAR